MNKRLVFDVTTIMWWNRPATGIVRVCYELFFWIKENDLMAIYLVFDPSTKKYYSISADSVMQHINSIADTQKLSRNANLREGEKSKFLFKVKREVLRITKQFKNLKLINSISANVFVKSFLLSKKGHQTDKIKIEEKKDFVFDERDLYLTIGLNWEFMQEETLYHLKKNIKFKVLTMCYDLIPVIFPHFTNLHATPMFNEYFNLLSWVSDYVLCISSSTQKDYTEFVEKYNYPNRETYVFKLGSNIHDDGEREKYFGQNHILKNNKYILYVSTIEIRKNHETIYNAYLKLIEDGIDDLPYLVFVGMHGWNVNDLGFKLAHDLRVNRKIIIFNYASDEELISLYKNCLFTIYPSLYEGWGLPIGESLNLGKFCISSSTSSMPEVGGTFVDYVHPLDTFGWVERLRFYIQNPNEICKKEEAIKEFYKPIKWENTIEDLMSFIHEK